MATNALRTWWLCFAICCLACTSATACMPSSERTIIFEHVPPDIDAPVIIEATIYDRSQVGDADGHQMFVMNARVDRVIKGSIDAKTMKIVVGIGGCTRAGIGQGIVLGVLRNDPQRGLELVAIEGSNARRGPRNSYKNKWTFGMPQGVPNELEAVSASASGPNARSGVVLKWSAY
jgi:hypothetical protein